MDGIYRKNEWIPILCLINEWLVFVERMNEYLKCLINEWLVLTERKDEYLILNT